MENTNLTNEEIQDAIQTLFVKVDTVDTKAHTALTIAREAKNAVSKVSVAPTNKYDLLETVADNLSSIAVAGVIIGGLAVMIYFTCKVDKKEEKNEN